MVGTFNLGLRDATRKGYTYTMSNYDGWLEAPYQKHYADEAAYVDWCEDNDIDADDDNWDAWQTAMENAADDAAMERAEAAREDAMFDRDDY